MHLYRHNDLPTNSRPSIRFWFVYVLAVVFNFHTLLTAYSNSTYLEQFITPEAVGVLYSIGALGSMILFLLLPHILRRTGNVVAATLFMVGSVVTLWLLGSASSVAVVVVAFILFLSLNPLLYLCIDIFSETLIDENEGETGKRRGLTLSLMSTAALLAPLTLAFIIGSEEALHRLYFVAAGIGLLFLVLIIAAFRHFYDPPYSAIKITHLLRQSWHDADIRIVLTAHFILQLFFTWVIIYVPLFMATTVGLSWTEIGSILSVGLLAYVLFEYPIGIVADKYIGEKEMMAVGFLLLALSTAAISFMSGFGVIGWMVLMFMSRVGASLVEVTTESYFFKKVNGRDADLMSLFRVTRPSANLCGAILGTVSLYFLPFELIFIVLALCMTVGIFITLRLHDTR